MKDIAKLDTSSLLLNTVAAPKAGFDLGDGVYSPGIFPLFMALFRNFVRRKPRERMAK